MSYNDTQRKTLADLEADLLAQDTKVRRGKGARVTLVHEPQKKAHYRRIRKHKRDWRDES